MKKIVLLLLFINSLSYANVYYVAVNGDNTADGSLANPWQTIQYAANNASAGAIVYIRGGAYNERVIFPSSGTVDAPIIFKNYAAEIVIIDGTGISWGGTWNGLLDITAKQYIQLEGLQVKNANYAAIFLENSNHITINKIQTYNSVSSGIGVWSCNHIIISNNTVEQACSTGNQECISVSNSFDCSVFENEVFNNGNGALGGEGIDIKQGSHDVNVYKNWVHNLNNRVGIYSDAWDQHTYNINIYQNKVNNCTETGIAIASEFGGLLEQVHIFNNIIYNNKYDGIQIGGWTHPDYTGTNTPISTIQIINNTCYNNGSIASGFGFGITIDNAFAANIQISNNILSQNSAQMEVVQSADAPNISNNLIDGSNDTTYAFTGANALVTSANFEDVANFDFHLGYTSEAIDAGLATNSPSVDYDGNARPLGDAVDIGAYEYNALLATHTPALTDFNFEVGPNPFDTTVTIKLHGKKPESCILALYNTSGALIYHDIVYNLNQEISINPNNDLPTGIYFLKIQFENQLLETFRLIKK